MGRWQRGPHVTSRSLLIIVKSNIGCPAWIGEEIIGNLQRYGQLSNWASAGTGLCSAACKIARHCSHRTLLVERTRRSGSGTGRLTGSQQACSSTLAEKTKKIGSLEVGKNRLSWVAIVVPSRMQLLAGPQKLAIWGNVKPCMLELIRRPLRSQLEHHGSLAKCRINHWGPSLKEDSWSACGYDRSGCPAPA